MSSVSDKDGKRGHHLNLSKEERAAKRIRHAAKKQAASSPVPAVEVATPLQALKLEADTPADESRAASPLHVATQVEVYAAAAGVLALPPHGIGHRKTNTTNTHIAKFISTTKHKNKIRIRNVHRTSESEP
jgi:hypothetical protein